MRNLLLVALLFPALPVRAAAPAGFSQALNEIRARSTEYSVKHADAFSTEDQLIDLSRDADPAVRKAAVRGLRNWMHVSRAKDRVLEVLRDRSERLEVRREAVKDLSVFLNDWTSNEALRDLARDGSEPVEMRALAMKAMYNAAPLDSGLRSFLTDQIKGYWQGNVVLRRAAVWGLFRSVQNDNSVRSELLDLLRSVNEATAVRIESLKSLYLAMADWNVQDEMKDLAKSPYVDIDLRYGAVLALSTRQTDYDTRSLLEDLSRAGHPAALRRAATLALGDPGNEEILAYFHLSFRRMPDGRYTDPLDGE